MDIERYNRDAWDRQVERHCRWTRPVDTSVIEAARGGDVQVVLTPKRSVPQDWFPPLRGCDTLCLAGAGGQQGPVLAAAGANVIVLDQSTAQLAQDRAVAAREELQLTTVQGEMTDLSMFADEQFELIVHPCSISFIPDVRPLWQEVARILRPGGVYLLGFCNPLVFLFDLAALEEGRLEARHAIPYSDLRDLPRDQLQRMREMGEPLCFGHSMESVLGGLLASGLQMTGLYEDDWDTGPESVLDQYLQSMLAISAVKPRRSGSG